MSRNLHNEFKYRKIKKPNKLIAFIVIIAIKIISKKRNVKFSYSDDYLKLNKKQIIVLSQHCSKDDYIYVFAGLKRSDVHIICGYQNVFQKGVYFLLKKLGVIAKYLYQPDASSSKQMLGALKLGDSLAIFPEGIQSTSGSTHPINPATINFLVKMKLPVVLTTIKGSYFTRTRYSTDVKKGKIEVNYDVLFNVEDYEKYSKEELYQKLLNAFKYNEYDYNKQEKVEFIGKKPNIYGLDNIIYKCPHCNSEFKFQVKDSNMKCLNCKFEFTMNNRYEISPINKELPFENVDIWYKWQRNLISKEVKSDSFILETKVKLYTINTKKLGKNYSLIEIGEGLLTLTNKGLQYKGVKNGEEVDVFFEANQVYSLSISLAYELDMYYKNEYYCFKPLNDDKQVVKWMLASEEIHNMYDEKWRKASEEVYFYE